MLTLNQLKFMVPYSMQEDREKFIEPINQTLEEFKIITPLRIAAFIAQVAHESGSLKYVEEIADGSAYEWRRDLGNLEKEALDAAHARGATTGGFYKGHGLIQVTGFYNHKKCGERLGLDLVNQPELLCLPINAARSAGWFWDSRHLNNYADLGMFKAITRLINGGYNGGKERLLNYERCKRVLGC